MAQPLLQIQRSAKLAAKAHGTASSAGSKEQQRVCSSSWHSLMLQIQRSASWLLKLMAQPQLQVQRTATRLLKLMAQPLLQIPRTATLLLKLMAQPQLQVSKNSNASVQAHGTASSTGLKNRNDSGQAHGSVSSAGAKNNNAASQAQGRSSICRSRWHLCQTDQHSQPAEAALCTAAEATPRCSARIPPCCVSIRLQNPVHLTRHLTCHQKMV